MRVYVECAFVVSGLKVSGRSFRSTRFSLLPVYQTYNAHIHIVCGPLRQHNMVEPFYNDTPEIKTPL